MIVISGLMFGGGQQITLDLAKESMRARIDLQIYLLGRKVPHLDYFKPQVIQYDGRYNRIDTLFKTTNRLRRWLKQKRPVLIHTHGWDADIIGWLARRGLGIEQLIHLHVTPNWVKSPRLKHAVRRWLTRRAFTSSGVWVVAVSNAVRLHWAENLGLNPARIQIIHNGVNTEYYQPMKKSSGKMPVPVIGVAARLAPMKGIEYLLDALGMLARDGLTFRLEIAGEGGYRKTLESRAQETGIMEQTFFLGHVEDMPAFYRSIDIYVLPSVSTEGLPLSVLEAMASSLPVVATTVAGIPEAVRNGQDGLLVPPRDAESLAEALRQLLSNETLRQRMGKSARQRAVEEFSVERFANEVFDLYQKMGLKRT